MNKSNANNKQNFTSILYVCIAFVLFSACSSKAGDKKEKTVLKDSSNSLSLKLDSTIRPSEWNTNLLLLLGPSGALAHVFKTVQSFLFDPTMPPAKIDSTKK